jgi:hypothetical protein
MTVTDDKKKTARDSGGFLGLLRSILCAFLAAGTRREHLPQRRWIGIPWPPLQRHRRNEWIPPWPPHLVT